MKQTLTLFVFAAITQFCLAEPMLPAADSMPVYGKLRYPLYDSSQQIGITEKGTLYALPLDGMTALRPDTSVKANMPVLRPDQRIIAAPPKGPKSFTPTKEIEFTTPYGRKRFLIPDHKK